MAATYPTPEQVFGVDTIPEALARAARSSTGIRLIDRDLTERRFDYADLDRAAARAAGALRASGIEPGDRVGLLAPTSPELLVALFGCWRADAVPLVLPLPRRPSELAAYVHDVAGRVNGAGARLLVVSELFAGQGADLSQAGVPIVTLEEIARSSAPPAPPATGSPDDLAFLQFTSGTTGRSRAVTLTHRQILTNLSAAGTMAGIDPDWDVIVSWLPLFHDMGLIGMLLGAVTFGVPLVLQPTEEFLARPGSWLDAVSRYGGTITAAPNFGYGLATRDLRNRPRPLNLSRWRVAANGAEAVDMETCAAFAGRAGLYGYRRETMCPMFGLAEATLAVTLSSYDEEPHVDWVSRDELETTGNVRWASPHDPGAKPLVSCGRPIPGTEVEIRDDAGQALLPGRVGEIWVRGPSVTDGYFANPEATAEILADGWLRTGDVGFWGADGLVVCGRRKDVIILGGRNLYPEDYEFWTERVPGVRRGNVIAFALPHLERMVVVAETTVPSSQAQIVARETLETLRRRLPRGPEEVVLVPAGTLPKTSSGKRQRGACRERYSSGTLDPLAVAKR